MLRRTVPRDGLARRGIGIDTRTAVDDSYELPFRFTGKIDTLTYKLGPEQLGENDQKAVQHAFAKAND
jgi:arylsulfatase